MLSEDDISCGICGSAIETDFRYCPYCGQTTNFNTFSSVKVPIPLGVVILSAVLIVLSASPLALGFELHSILFLGIAVFDIVTGVLLFYGYWFAKYLAIIASLLLVWSSLTVLVSIPVVFLLTIFVLIVYLTRAEVVAYFEQGPKEPLSIKYDHP